ncbi:MAG: hypothetical protein EOO43_17610, partial [Flavobacterium sp.]
MNQILHASPASIPARKLSILDKSNNTLIANNVRGQINFDNTYGRHSITAIAGAETRSTSSNGHQERFYGYNINNLTTGNVDYTKAYPNIITNRNAFITNSQSLSDRSTRFISYFVN